MPRNPVSRKEFAELLTNRHKHGMAELQTKDLTEEEESQRMKETFSEIAAMGYEHIHTLKVVPSDGRESYYVQIDSINRE